MICPGRNTHSVLQFSIIKYVIILSNTITLFESGKDLSGPLKQNHINLYEKLEWPISNKSLIPWLITKDDNNLSLNGLLIPSHSVKVIKKTFLLLQ